MIEAITVKDLYKLYRVGDSIVRALDGVSFEIHKGEFCAIVGTSGSGKSTLLNMLAGLEKPTKGEIVISGSHIEKMKEDELVRFRREHVGFIFQSFHLIGTMNALENVALPLYYQGVSRRKRNAEALEYLDRLGLRDWAHHMPNEMSGGQKQRVAIARALINKPQIILADEPTGALDSVTSHEVMDLLRQVNNTGMTIVCVTHERSIAEQTDKIIHIKDGIISSTETLTL